MNVFCFEGRVATAPELTNNSGTKVCRVRLIRNEYAGTDEASGERREDREVAINFVSFQSRAEAIAEHVFVGDQLIVTADITNNDYIPKGGSDSDKVYGYSFRIKDFAFGAPGAKKREWLANSHRGSDHQR